MWPAVQGSGKDLIQPVLDNQLKAASPLVLPPEVRAGLCCAPLSVSRVRFRVVSVKRERQAMPPRGVRGFAALTSAFSFVLSGRAALCPGSFFHGEANSEVWCL